MLRRIGVIGLCGLLGSLLVTGCKSGDTGMVDKPLTTDAGPPPARPDKPTISPSGAGGAPAGGAAPSGTTSPP